VTPHCYFTHVQNCALLFFSLAGGRKEVQEAGGFTVGTASAMGSSMEPRKDLPPPTWAFLAHPSKHLHDMVGHSSPRLAGAAMPKPCGIEDLPACCPLLPCSLLANSILRALSHNLGAQDTAFHQQHKHATLTLILVSRPPHVGFWV